MLKKAQIAAIPRMSVPPVGENNWAANAEIIDGLLIVDIVNADGKQARYANDGKNEITAIGVGDDIIDHVVLFAPHDPLPFPFGYL